MDPIIKLNLICFHGCNFSFSGPLLPKRFGALPVTEMRRRADPPQNQNPPLQSLTLARTVTRLLYTHNMVSVFGVLTLSSI